MPRLVAISDVHGNIEGLTKALIEAKVINESGNRYTDADNRCFVLQIGDLANCVRDSVEGDLLCLKKVGTWIDLMLMGNHEHPYFGGIPFAGFYRDERVGNALLQLEAMNKIKPCFLRKDTLITHAGWDHGNHPVIGGNAKEVASHINATHYAYGWENPIFNAIGHSRGGRYPHGGILWEDFSDLRSNFPQIVGHTSDDRVRYKSNALCIDTQKSSGKPLVIEVV